MNGAIEGAVAGVVSGSASVHCNHRMDSIFTVTAGIVFGIVAGNTLHDHGLPVVAGPSMGAFWMIKIARL
jgi:hypothetical protein